VLPELACAAPRPPPTAPASTSSRCAPAVVLRESRARSAGFHQHNATTARARRCWYGGGILRDARSRTAARRYAQSSGDSNRATAPTVVRPLFFCSACAGPAGHGYLGEIYGQYLGTISNLNISQFHVRASPTSELNIGLLYYLADFNQPAQFGATSRGAFHEINVYAEWTPVPWLTITPTFGVNIPRNGYREIAQAAVVANGLPTTTPTDRSIYLFQTVLAVKF
jgi:hypothetical protein